MKGACNLLTSGDKFPTCFKKIQLNNTTPPGIVLVQFDQVDGKKTRQKNKPYYVPGIDRSWTPIKLTYHNLCHWWK